MSTARVSSAADLPEWVMREALASIGMALSIADLSEPDLPLVFVNPAFEALTGYRTDQCLGRNCRFLQGPGTSESAKRRIREALANRRPTRARLLNYRADGTAFWNEVSLVPVAHPDGGASHVVGLQRDVTFEVERERALAVAGRDDLTNLPTRRALRQALTDAVGVAAAVGRAVAVVFIDVNGLKQVNDAHGHAAGDRLLEAVARSLEKTVRPGDLVSRYGGDEFVVLLDRLDRREARSVASRLRRDLCEALVHSVDGTPGAGDAVTASVGVALYPDDATTPDELLRRADAQMYRHKRGLAE